MKKIKVSLTHLNVFLRWRGWGFFGVVFLLFLGGGVLFLACLFVCLFVCFCLCLGFCFFLFLCLSVCLFFLLGRGTSRLHFTVNAYIDIAHHLNCYLC